MNEEYAELLKNLADRIGALLEKGNIKQIFKIEKAADLHTFVLELYKLQKKSAVEKLERPLLTFDELFAIIYSKKHGYWKDAQMLILFRLYETLHDQLAENDLLDEEIDELKDVNSKIEDIQTN